MKEKSYGVIFGSNKLDNCKGVFYAVKTDNDEEDITFREGEDGKIVLNCTMKDEEGNIVAKIENSNVNVGKDYDLKEGNPITVKNKSGEVWLDFEEIGSNHFKLNGKFYIFGHEIVATDETLFYDRSEIGKNEFNGNHGFLKINADSFSIGF
ncbi:MAG: hypothetical protein K8E24_006010 [Methanobacterium paludis]|nr:hypothetical protein [Methanobacterium paludis]